MEKNKATLKAAYGETVYQEKMDTLKKLLELEIKGGVFQALDGNIDSRESRKVSNWNDLKLHEGFKI